MSSKVTEDAKYPWTSNVSWILVVTAGEDIGEAYLFVDKGLKPMLGPEKVRDVVQLFGKNNKSFFI
jgi:hypothetical protein